jgi:exopolysaccharide production protein ExoQ
MMSSATSASVPAGLRWRTVEWWGAGIALFLQMGAIFPVLLMDDSGGLSDSARSQLRALNMPAYVIAAALLSRHPSQVSIALRRNLPIVVLIVLAVLSIAWSQSPSITVRRVVALLGSALIAYLLALRFTPHQLVLLLGYLLAPLMLLSLAAVATGSGNGPATGVFINKNVLGWVSAFAVIVGYALTRDAVIGRRSLGVILLSSATVCLTSSTSTTALMAVFAAVVFGVVHQMLRRVHGLSRLLLIVLLIWAAAAFLSSLQVVIVPVLELLGKDATLTGRVPLWNEVDEAIAARPLLGYGYQAFWTPASAEAWRIWATVGWDAPHAHNGYRETMLSLGIVGFATFATVVLRGLGQGASLERRAPAQGWHWLNVFIGTFLVMNLTESLILAQNDFFWILFMACVIMMSLRYRDDPVRDRD